MVNLNRHDYRLWKDHIDRGIIPNNKKILALNSFFWSTLLNDPSKLGDGYQKKFPLAEYDVIVMPMFGECICFSFLIEAYNNDHFSKHWRLGIIENPAGFFEDKT